MTNTSRNGSPNRRPATHDHESPAGEPFTWMVGDEKIELPPFRSLMTFGRARRLRKLDPEDQLFSLLEEALPQKTLDLLDPLEPEEMDRFFTAWQEHSGITAGE